MGTTPGDLASLQAEAAQAAALAADLGTEAADVQILNAQVLAAITWIKAEHPGATVTRLVRDPYIGIKLPTFVQQTTSVVVSPSTATTSGAGATQQFTAIAYDQETPAQPMSPQPTFNWTTSNTGIATINAGTGLATSIGPGTCSVTATISVGGGLGIHGSGALTVNAAFNEPTGMTVVLDSGPITLTTAQLQSASAFTFTGGTLQTTAQNISPTTKNGNGEWNQNLVASPSGSGMRFIYDPTLVGGNSPVRVSFQAYSTKGTGTQYIRRYLTVSSNWVNNISTGVKTGEPHTTSQGNPAGAAENHIQYLSYNVTGNNTVLQPGLQLQGPNGQARNVFPATSGVGIVTGGAQHVVEDLFTPETTPGAGNGGYQCWVDGSLVINHSDITWIASGQTVGWPNYLIDPVFGGIGASPQNTQYWEIDKIHISVK